MKLKKNIFKINNMVIIAILFICLFIFFFFYPNNKENIYMIDLTNYNIEQIQKFAEINELQLIIRYEYTNTISKDKVISQNIKEDAFFRKNDKLIVTILRSKISIPLYKEYKVDELGVIPIMMYHGIHHLNNSDTIYTGGNVDKNGYNRTTEAFINDLEMYYQRGYRMIKLNDYIEGNIDVELGKSPIILTFDDGAKNNMKILGRDEKGELIIDPNSAVGILEQFKIKYPDYNVTATFFLNKTLFNQNEYDHEILKWLVNNGYDIGNHTSNHYRISDLSINETIKEIATMYQLLEQIIPNKYVKIVALPYGIPNKTHNNFSAILTGTYNNFNYNTISTLRVGWEAELSPFDINYDKTYLKRIRAWDNNGLDDIEMHFNKLETTRYISSGLDNYIVIPKIKENRINTNINKQIITYE